ncbi:hypothetical protein MTO96_015926 [Rhipicephalus appendiculatus]
MAGCSSGEMTQLLRRSTLRLHRSRSLHGMAVDDPPPSDHSCFDVVPLRRRSLSLGARCVEEQFNQRPPNLQRWDDKGVGSGATSCPAGEPQFVYALVRSPGVTCLLTAVRVSSVKAICTGQ